MKDTFASKTFHSKTFASGDWQGLGVDTGHKPNALLGDVTLDYENEGDIGFDVDRIAAVGVEP